MPRGLAHVTKAQVCHHADHGQRGPPHGAREIAALRIKEPGEQGERRQQGQAHPGKEGSFPYSDEMGWEESGWIAAHRARQALAIALTAMIRDGEISRGRALELANLVLRDNARKLYGL